MLDWVLIMPLVRLQILSQIERNRSKTEQQGRWTVKDEKSMFRKMKNSQKMKLQTLDTKNKKKLFSEKKKKKKKKKTWTFSFIRE